MATADHHGLPLTTFSAAAAELYADGVYALVTERSDAEAPLAAAAQADPAFALPHAALALARLMDGDARAAREHAARAQLLAVDVTPRERAHVVIAGELAAGSAAAARRLLAAHLAGYPRDALMLFFAVWLDVGSGHRESWHGVRVRLAELRGAYGEESFFLGTLAFAHVETGDIAGARALAHGALVLDPFNANAIHCMAHVEGARHDEGAGFQRLSRWLMRERAPERCTHMCAHLAIAALGRGDPTLAMGIYREHIGPAVRARRSPAVLVDAAQLLWRLQLAGADARREWPAVAELARELSPARSLAPIVVVHAAMALAGDSAELAALRAAQAELAAQGSEMARVLLAVVDGVIAHAGGQHERAILALESALPQVGLLGATGDQRSIVAVTLATSRARRGASPGVSGPTLS